MKNDDMFIFNYSGKEISSDIEIFKDCAFYYDETNNIRKLRFDINKNNFFNNDIDKDFVVGGVMCFKEYDLPDIESLREKLKLDKDIKEIKARHITKSEIFLECLKEDKVYKFLEWLYESNLFIHYYHMNIFYYGVIIDIIESVDFFMASENIELQYEIKNVLFIVAKMNYDFFCKLLVKYNFPNIEKKIKIIKFINEIIKLIDKTELVSYGDDFKEFIIRGFQKAKKQEELLFLKGNDLIDIIDDTSFAQLYSSRIQNFKYAKHIFDNEEYKERKIEEFKKYEICRNFNNYSFEDSKQSPLIQISDCIVGLLGKFFAFINKISLKEAYLLPYKLTDKQLDTLRLFTKVIFKSELLSQTLYTSIWPIESWDIRNIIYEISDLDNIKREIKLDFPYIQEIKMSNKK